MRPPCRTRQRDGEGCTASAGVGWKGREVGGLAGATTASRYTFYGTHDESGSGRIDIHICLDCAPAVATASQKHKTGMRDHCSTELRRPRFPLTARSRRPGNTAVAPFESHTAHASHGIQSHIMTTHSIQSIHLGPCLDQHPACSRLARIGSVMENRVFGLLDGGVKGLVLLRKGE